MYKHILICLMFLGVIMIVINVTKTETLCPPTKTVYRFVPRTFAEEQEFPPDVTELYRSMFDQSSPWINSVDSLWHHKRENVNRYFISQY